MTFHFIGIFLIMIIDCVGCLHGQYPEMKGGDLLIITGDLTRSDEPYQYEFLYDILKEQKYKKIIIIAGNHDNCLQDGRVEFVEDSLIEYLCDSGTTFKGLKIWGSPWTSRFEGINPKACAFTMATDEEIASKWSLIPKDTDILVTHGPPFTIRDLTIDNLQVGSPALLARHIFDLRPKLWAFSHIHESYGQEGPYAWSGTRYVNCSLMNERYQAVNAPIRIILDDADFPDGT